MKKILLVTASGSLRDVIQFALLQKNYQLLLADNGQGAIDLISDNKVDLVISCSNLPIIDGPSLSKLIYKHAQSRFTPVLLLLNEPIKLAKNELLPSNISSALNIPFNMDELLFKIEKSLPI